MCAVLAVTDPLKPEARGVVAALARCGLAVHLVTGDNWRTARAIAEQLAIINVCAECLPGAKADKIRVRLPCRLPLPSDNAFACPYIDRHAYTGVRLLGPAPSFL